MQRCSTSLVFRALMWIKGKSWTVPRAGTNAKQLEFLDIAKWDAKRHSTLEHSEAFSYQVKDTINHITKQVYNINLQKKICTLMSKTALLQ